MSDATPQQVRQWSEEVAADPASLSFLPLAQAYRGMAKRDAALRLVLRGLEKHPTNVEAHFLLGLLYREGGDTLKAYDEFGTVLTLSPEHPEARRETGLTAAALGRWDAAVRHLERAHAHDPADNAVANALAVAQNRLHPRPDPSAGPSTASASGNGTAAAAPAAEEPWSGARAFEALQSELRSLLAERGIVGAMLLDEHGYVTAGEVRSDAGDRAAEVAAVLGGASAEAERTVRHLALGAWRGILVETPEGVVRMVPAEDGGLVVVAARRDVPTGWVLRVAARAREAASRFLARAGGGR